MRITVIVAAAGLAAACHTSRAPSSLGVRGNLDEADRHEREARIHDEEANAAEVAARKHNLVCGDTVLADQATSGGKPLILRTPCWSPGGEEAARQRGAADRLRADAAAHRRIARVLAEAADHACEEMPPTELDHTPFAHRDDIASVAADLDGDRVIGARIHFHAVAGLDAAWLRTAIGCFQARAAEYGWDPTYNGYDPTLIDGASVTVTDDLTVIVHAADPGAALSIYGRAEDLIAR